MSASAPRPGATTGVRVRPARRADAPALAEMGTALAEWLANPDPRRRADDILRHAFGPGRWCDILVAERGGTVVGYAAMSPRFQLHAGHRELFLSDLYVAPGARRDGVGEALMRAVAQRALDLGAPRVTWEVWTRNRLAFDFYDALGAARDDDITVMSFDAAGLARLAAGEGGLPPRRRMRPSRSRTTD